MTAQKSPLVKKLLQLATRATVAFVAAFVLGRAATGGADGGIFAAIAALLLVFANFGGRVRTRLAVYAGVTAAAACAAMAGTLAGRPLWLAAAVTFAFALVVSFAGVTSGYAAGSTTTILLFLVIGVGLVAKGDILAATIERGAGVALGCAVAFAAGLLLWRDRSVKDLRAALAGAFDALGAYLDLATPGAIARTETAATAVLEGTEAHAQPAERPAATTAATASLTAGAAADDLAAAAQRAVTACHAGLAKLPFRPVGNTAEERSQLALIFELDRMLARALRLVPLVLDPDAAPVRADAAPYVAQLGDSLHACAASLLRRGDPPDDTALAGAVTAFAGRMRREVATLTTSTAGRDELARASGAVVSIAELFYAASHAAGHVRLLAGFRSDVLAATGVPEFTGRLAAVRGRLRASFGPGSVVLDNGLRTAVALTAAVVVAGILLERFGVQRPYWITFTTLLVMKSTAGGSAQAAFERVVGTAVGAALAALVVITIGGDKSLLIVLLVLLVFLFGPAQALNRIAGAAVMTVVMIVMLAFAARTPIGPGLAGLRLQQTAIGAFLGIAAGLVMWPRGSASVLPKTLRHMLDGARGLAVDTTRAFLRPGSRLPDAHARRGLVDSAIRVEYAVLQYLTETPDPRLPAESVLGCVHVGERLVTTATLPVHVIAPYGENAAGQFAGELDGRLDDVDAGYRTAIDGLAAGHLAAGPPTSLATAASSEPLSPAADTCLAGAATGDSRALGNAARLFAVRTLVLDLADTLTDLDNLTETDVAPGRGADTAPAGAAHHAFRIRERIERLRTNYAYGWVLILLMASFFWTAVAPRGDWAVLVSTALHAAALLLTLWTSRLPIETFRILAVVVVCLVTAALAALFVRMDVAALVAGALNVLLIAGAPVAIVWGLCRQTAVDKDTILGALCIYLFIGMLFTFAFSFAGSVSPPFFRQTADPPAVDYLYFSFVTITTVGYGDLTPVASLGKVLAVIEALLGQIYLVTVIAMLVGRFGQRRHTSGGDGSG